MVTSLLVLSSVYTITEYFTVISKHQTGRQSKQESIETTGKIIKGEREVMSKEKIYGRQ